MTRPPAFRPADILSVLGRHHVQYVLIGGFAAQIHGSTLPTTDIDVTPVTTRQNLDRLAVALRELGAGIRVDDLPDGLPFDTSAEALAAMRVLNLRTPHGDLDLTFEPDGTAGYDDLARGATSRHPGAGRQPGRHHPLQAGRRPAQGSAGATRTRTPRPNAAHRPRDAEPTAAAGPSRWS